MSETRSEVARRELAAVLAEIDANPWPTDIVEARALYDRLGPPLSADIRTEHFEIGGMPAQLLIPPDAEPGRAVLFLHGGGYVYGSIASHHGMVGEIARASRCVALLLQYRLAPEHPFPAALDDACAGYAYLRGRGYQPDKLAIVGDSAGGGLVMSTLLTLRETGRPLPGVAVLVSPWVDLEHTGESWTTRQQLDPMLDRPLVDLVSGHYLQGKSPSDPIISSIKADLRGLPPMLIQVGEREVLFSDAERLAARAREAGVEVVFEEWKDMVHVWHLYFAMLGAGREAMTRIGEFIVAKTGTPARKPR